MTWNWMSQRRSRSVSVATGCLTYPLLDVFRSLNAEISKQARLPSLISETRATHRLRVKALIHCFTKDALPQPYARKIPREEVPEALFLQLLLSGYSWSYLN